MCTMAIENNCGVWSVDGVDGPHLCEDVVPNTSFLNMKNICIEIGKPLKNDVLQLVVLSSNCILETTPLKFHLLGFIFNE
jgi:hypothetical protein